jgi:protein-tyrosine phosphatase
MKTINWVLFPLVFLIYSCSQEIYDLPAEERLIPSELSFDKRERYRKLPLKGAHNFRELGGFETLDNRKVKWGLLYRSDALNELSDEDLEYLQRLKLNAIIDFRSPIERNDKPDRFIENVNVHLMPIDPFGNNSSQDPNKSFEEIQREMFYGDLDISNFLVDFNQDLVSYFQKDQWASNVHLHFQ